METKALKKESCCLLKLNVKEKTFETTLNKTQNFRPSFFKIKKLECYVPATTSCKVSAVCFAHEVLSHLVAVLYEVYRFIVTVLTRLDWYCPSWNASGGDKTRVLILCAVREVPYVLSR